MLKVNKIYLMKPKSLFDRAFSYRRVAQRMRRVPQRKKKVILVLY